jgi:O-antigen/teichoic acid export membrane protein
MIAKNSSNIVTGDAGFVTVSRPRPSAEGDSNRPIDPNEKHLCTDHLLGDLKGRTISSAFVTIAAQGAQFVLNLGSIMALARLLTPKDFGLFAMVTTVMGFLRVFKDAGLSTATIQREGITHAQVSNLFWINVVLSGAMSVILAISSPVIAWFYREPRLVGITLILSSTFLLSGLTVQHTALLNRQMRFIATAVIQVGSMLVGVVVGIVMAWLNSSYWALVWGNFATVAASVVLTWIAIPWRPQAPLGGSGTRSLIGFGANLTTGGFLWSFARGADAILIGRFCGPDSVGLYTRAGALLHRPMEQFLSPLHSVFVPALSRIQTQPERYRRAFLRVYEAMALVGCLSTGLLFALARPLTLVVLGAKWEQTAAIFAGLTIAAFCLPLGTASTWLFISQGRGRDWLFSSVLGSTIMVVSFVVGLPFGPVGVAIGYSTFSLFLGMPVLYYFAGRAGPVSAADLWRGIFRFVPLWIVVCGATWVLRILLVNYPPFLQLVVCAPVGLLAGAILIYLVPSMRRVAFSLVDILRELKSRAGSLNTR